MSRKTSKRIVLYQKFIDASNRIADPYWKEIFRKLAYGKVPGSFIVTNESLSFRKRRKIQDVIQIPERLSDEQILKVKDFIMKYSGKRSKIDLELEKRFVLENASTEVKRPSEMEWKAMKKNKKLLEMLKLDLIEKERKEKNLNEEEVKTLSKTIKLGMIIDAFQGFKFDEDSRVIGLFGLEFDEESRVYYINSSKLNIFKEISPAERTKVNSTSNESSETSEFLLTPNCLRIKKVNIMKSWNSKMSEESESTASMGEQSKEKTEIK